MHDGYLKAMPRFNVENCLSVEDHLTAFQDCTENLSVDIEESSLGC